jgi:DNA recombination-dependent growth factor C
MTQTEAILNRLKQGRLLTPIDALNDPEIRSFRLAARIQDLRRQGLEIETVKIHTESGKTLAGYRLPWKGELF